MPSKEARPLAIPPELDAEMTAAVRAFVETLLDRITKLEHGRKTPQSSSLPPSTQHPHTQPQPPRRKSKKKRGGQPGHEKHERPLIPTKEFDDVQPLWPTECRRCRAKLSGSDPEPLRHQVWEVPEIKPHVTEYQRHRLMCPCCGATTCAELPLGVPRGQPGPQLMALTALLMAFYRQGKRRTAEFLGMLLSQLCCPSLTVKIQSQVTAALRPSYEEVAAALPDHEQVNIDETATKEENGKAWLWMFLYHEGVEPTNNAGERSLRHAVIWRKFSFGTQSASGSRFVETMLTAIETCRQQRRNVFAFVTNAVEAHLAHQSTPSLLTRR
jgi:transposase